MEISEAGTESAGAVVPRQAVVEIETILRIVEASEQDWQTFERASKRLGSNAERAIRDIKEKMATIAMCARDGLAHLHPPH